MTLPERAVEISASAHQGQVDKAGSPYIEHFRRVAEQVDSLEEKIVSYVRDTLEKGNGWSAERLREAGFGATIIGAAA